MKGRYKKESEVFGKTDPTTELPVDGPIAIYYRQSTEAQIGNISTSMQTVDMVSYLKSRGWSDKNIHMIDMDGGISGSTKIDERPGMKRLFELITSGAIGAVACQDEDRLFRDVTQIQVNIFIEACRKAGVVVLTPSITYDFANEMTGTFHARQFRFKAEMAAEYVNAVIRGRLHKAKRRMMMEGRWSGGGIPVGFMADIRKTLPDGSQNENWKRYVPFDPYIEVVNEYFRLFLSCGGSIRGTLRHIQKNGPFYPDPAQNPPPQGYKIHYKFHRYKIGYHPGRAGLSHLLTNVAYIGHWTVNDVVVRWNNHPAIVPEDIFMRAFNYLSATNFDGRINKQYSPHQENARPTKEENRNVGRPLLSGMIVSQLNGKWRNVGTNWVGPSNHYSYALWSTYPKDNYVWSKASKFVDEAVVQLVQRKLIATFDSSVWEQTLKRFEKDYQKEQKQIKTQLEHLETVMENLINSLSTLNNPHMIKAAESRYEEAQEEHKRLQTILRDMNSEATQLEELYGLKEAYGPTLENWPNMTRNEKRVVLHAFINRIEATPVEGHGLYLRICWKDNTHDEITLPRQASTGTQWLPDETALLLELVETGRSEIEIAASFPERKWSLIYNKYLYETGKGIKFKPKLIRYHETFTDFVERVGEEFLADMGFEDCSEKVRLCGLTIFHPAWARRRRRPVRRS